MFREEDRDGSHGPDRKPEHAAGGPLYAETWDRVKRRLRAELGDDIFTSWFARLEMASLSEGCARLTVPTRFLKSWLEAHYIERVLGVFRSELPIVTSVAITVRGAIARDPAHFAKLGSRNPATVAGTAQSAARPGQVSGQFSSQGSAQGASDGKGSSMGSSMGAGSSDAQDSTPHSASSREDRNHPAEFSGAPLDPRLTFESFVVGRSNALAQAAAERVARHQGGPALYNPLYLQAGVGLGKTHLLHAIGHQARLDGRRVIYLTADRFMYGFVSSLKAQTSLAFKEKLRGIDLLIIDDVQFIQGRSIQQEFGHTLNALIDAGRQIIVASDRSPTELEALDERVRSRLAGGLVVEITALDEQLRGSILKTRLDILKGDHPTFDVSPQVISYVAHAITANGRDLEGAVNRLLAHATLTGAPVTLETAEVAIRDLVRNREPKRVKIEEIQKLVASRYNVSRSDILSERRTAAVVRPRQIAMYLSKILTLRSLPEIGRRFGGRDHTTVLHAVRKIEKALGEDTILSDEVELLKRMLQE